jgi:PAS domain S-box-containing protein
MRDLAPSSKLPEPDHGDLRLAFADGQWPVTMDLLEALETALQHLCRALGADAAGVHLVDGEAAPSSLRLYAQHGLSAAEEQAAALGALNGSLVGRCVRTGAPLAGLDDLAPDQPRAPWEEGHRTFSVWPLISDHHVAAGGGALGCLWMLSRAGEMASGSEVILPLFASQLAEAIAHHFELAQVTSARDEYQELLAHLRDAIWSIYVEPELKTVLVSDGIEGLTGYTPQEFMDQPNLWLDIVYPDDRGMVVEENRRAIAGAIPDLHYRARIIRKDGEMRWAHTRARATQDDAGWRLYGLTTDVTDHVRLEEKVRRADRLSAVGMLAGGIAHEYNNLHFAILGSLDLLLMRDDLDDAVRQHINRVREAAERASDITTKLVAFARGGTGGREMLDVAELVESALGLVQKEFSTLGIDVETKLSPLPLRVEGNRAELGQVIINLLINAQQAMRDLPTQRLTVTTGLDADRRVCITVADTGHGISADNLPRVFDPFFTTKGAAGSWLEERTPTEAHLPGRGLGLSVAQTIVQEHGGDIEAESEIGCGSRFTVRLPAPDRVADSQRAGAPAAVVSGSRILIADDETPVREVCREMLERHDYVVAEAAGGAEALELLQQQPFDLVLVDLQMPDMTGLELIRRINEIPDCCRPAKLIITGNIDEVPPETCAELGIVGLLQKRANLSELISKVQLALASRQG